MKKPVDEESPELVDLTPPTMEQLRAEATEEEVTPENPKIGDRFVVDGKEVEFTAFGWQEAVEVTPEDYVAVGKSARKLLVRKRRVRNRGLERAGVSKKEIARLTRLERQGKHDKVAKWWAAMWSKKEKAVEESEEA